MATAGKRLLGTDGKRMLNADGKRRLFNASGECPACCEEYTCAACGDCCFSTASVAEILYDLTTITTSAGVDFDDAWLSKTEAGMPFEANFVTSFIWTADPLDATSFIVTKDCVSGDWNFATPATTDLQDTDVLDYYLAEVQPFSGDCCGASTESATIFVSHYTRPNNAAPFTLVATRQGTGPASVEITNNGCCHDGAACQEIEGNCDGECPEM